MPTSDAAGGRPCRPAFKKRKGLRRPGGGQAQPGVSPGGTCKSRPSEVAPRRAGFVIAALLLTACDATGLPGATASRTTVNVAGQALTIAAPSGFCIDRDSTATSDAGAFVLMSDCALLGGGGTPTVPAAMTASISTGGLGGEGDDPVQSLADLAEFVGSGEGRALLGRSGGSGAVRVLATQQQGEVLYVLVEDRGPQPIPGVDRRFWRAFLEVDGHIVALSVLGFEDSGLDAQEGLDLVAALAAATRAANGA